MKLNNFYLKKILNFKNFLLGYTEILSEYKQILIDSAEFVIDPSNFLIKSIKTSLNKRPWEIIFNYTFKNCNIVIVDNFQMKKDYY